MLMSRFSDAQKILKKLLTSLIAPKPKSSLPRIAFVLVSVSLAPCYAKNHQWNELQKTLPFIARDLRKFKIWDNDIEMLLQLCAKFCKQGKRKDIEKEVWSILQEQLERIGEMKKPRRWEN